MQVKKIKVYTTLVHSLKAFGRAANFGTLPKTVRQMKTGVSQGRDFLNYSRAIPRFVEMVEQNRVEVTLTKIATLPTTINKVWEVGTKICCALDALLISIGPYGDEAQHLLDVARDQSSTQGRESRKLNYIDKVFVAHLLNAFGICTVDVLRHLTGWAAMTDIRDWQREKQKSFFKVHIYAVSLSA